MPRGFDRELATGLRRKRLQVVNEEETQKILDAYVTATLLGQSYMFPKHAVRLHVESH